MSIHSLLLVDDQPNDLRIAADAAREIGIRDVMAQNSVGAARNYLEQALNGSVPLPDGIVLDLDFGYESGFELLRFWHGNPQLSSIPMIVWSILEDQRGICELFKVKHFVGKWEGPKAIREALAQLAS